MYVAAGQNNKNYPDELEWLFNNRENLYLFSHTLLKFISADNLKYKVLTTLI